MVDIVYGKKFKNNNNIKNTNAIVEKTYKTILVGEASVGKSSITTRYMDKLYRPDYQATIGIDFQTKVFIQEDGKQIRLQVWDTAGSCRFRAITQSFYRGSGGVFIVFDVSVRSTFEKCKYWIQDIKEKSAVTNPNYPHQQQLPVMFLLGNKCDLANREVTYKEANDFAKENGMTYFETSAKDNKNVNDVFEEMMTQMIEQEKEPFVSGTKLAQNPNNNSKCMCSI